MAFQLRAIATSGRMETAAVNLAVLGVDPEQTPVVTRDQVKYAKPDPDLFLAAAERLGAPIEPAVVVGDSIWDILAAVFAVPSALVCFAAAMVLMSCSGRERFACMTILPCFCCISMKSVGAGDVR